MSWSLVSCPRLGRRPGCAADSYLGAYLGAQLWPINNAAVVFAQVLDTQISEGAKPWHRGLLTTLHAGGPDEVPSRLEAMAMTAPGAVLQVVRELIGALHAVVHLERGPSGRRIATVAELRTDGEGRVRALPLRVLDPSGLVGTGRVPAWAHLLPVETSRCWDGEPGAPVTVLRPGQGLR